MFLAKASIKRPIMMTMFLLVFIIFGMISFSSLNLNQMPEVEIPFITITTVYPGAGPKEIETQITKKIEDQVATVSEIGKMSSFSIDGASIIIIEFDIGKDVNVANQEVKDKVDMVINELPDDAMDPLVQKVDLQAFPIVDVVLSGDLNLKELYDIADNTLKDRFSQIAGVARVEITGGQEREIQVVLDNRVAFEKSISMPQLIQILQAYNMDIPGGYFQLNDQEYTVRVNGEFENLEEMREQQIGTMSGPMKIKQFASVVDGGKEIRERSVYFNAEENYRDENVVRLGIIKSSDGNIVNVAENTLKMLPEIQESLPPGVKIEVVNDNSVFVRSTVDDTIWNILLGVAFTSIVLLLFLHNIRATIIVALSMPSSIMSTFLLMDLFDMTLNMLSLMGISVSVGVLVANSVVVLENIFYHKQAGKNKKDAAFFGARGVMVAVIAATMTNLVVFLPIANMQSMVGMFLAELALAAAFSTIFSLIMSFTLTPMLASLILPKEMKSGPIGRAIDSWSGLMDRLYGKVLSLALKNKFISFLVVLGTFLLFIGSILFYFPQSYDPAQENRIGQENFPVIDNSDIQVIVELPAGYNLGATAEKLKEIEDTLKQDSDIRHILTNIGKKSELDQGANLAIMDVKLTGPDERVMGIEEKASLYIQKLSSISNANIIVQKKEGEGPGGAPIEFFLLGQSLEKLETYKNKVMELTRDIPGLINYDNSSRPGKPEIIISPKREKLTEAGLTVAELALTTRAAIEGIESTVYKDQGNEYDITVTMSGESVNAPEKIRNIPIVSQTGAVYRLSQIADVEFASGYTKILHENKYKAIQFTGANSPQVALGDVTSKIAEKLDEIDFESGYTWTWGGNIEMQKEMEADFMFAFGLAILLTYMLLAAILESFFQPFIILTTLPLAMIGVFTSMYLMGINFNIVSNMAVVMLIGIVVNNAILILDNVNQKIRGEGFNAKEAIIEGAPEKLRAIIMSTSAIILGMLPMALGIGDAGREMRIPLGVVSIGGLVFSTFLTLVFVPSAFYLVTRAKKKKGQEIEMNF